jgi:hypothetical protein
MLRDVTNDAERELLWIEGLGDVVVGPVAQRADGICDGRERGHQDHRSARRLLPETPEDGKPVDLWQTHIEDGHVEDALCNQGDCLLTVRGLGYPVTGIGEGVRETEACRLVIVDDEDLERHRGAQRWNV